MDLPKNEASFSINYEGEVTGIKFEGKFTCLCVLTIAQKRAKELEHTRIMADYKNPTDALAGLAEILSTLRARITDSPVWWQQSNGGADIMDEGLLLKLYGEVQKAEASWREQVKTKAQNLTPKSDL